MTALLSTPNSFASSYTRTFATTLLLGPVPYRAIYRTGARAERAPGRPQPMVIIAACSPSAHQLLDPLSDRYVFLLLTCCLALPRPARPLRAPTVPRLPRVR